jgi:transposase InsO family protein
VRHKIERLMRAQALRARPRRRALPKDAGERSVSAIAPNVLDRQFTAGQPNCKWMNGWTTSLMSGQPKVGSMLLRQSICFCAALSAGR